MEEQILTEHRKSILIKDTTREERERIVHEALWVPAALTVNSAPAATIAAGE